MLGVAVAATAIVAGQQPASAADLADFKPGDIISDGIFFDEDTMSEAAIQSFLSAKVPSCAVANACLKSYKETTRNIPADPMCKSPYKGGTSETAARIIYKVAQACGVNPQVLIVTLQKEQGLVTATNPSARQYRSATGYGCPDTAPCDAEYYGFFNQVYKAAWAFQRYTMPPGTGPGTEWYSVYSRYAAGKTATIQYHPNTSCGTSKVYIANKATGSLYFYTPYRPNAAALNAGYGVGDSCSAYGNRNFFNYFTDWFGSTHDPASVAIVAKYTELGGATGPLGAQVGEENCDLVREGCLRRYENGLIYATPKLGAHVVNGEIRERWKALGWEAGVLGYPIMDPKSGLNDGGTYQKFENGTIHTSPATGAHAVRGVILDAWAKQKWEQGALGYPTTEMACNLPDNGCYQKFQGGSIHWSADSGAHPVPGPLLKAWGGVGYERGDYGYPVAGAKTAGSDTWQEFQGGVLVVRGTTVTEVPGKIGAAYADAGGPGGSLGAPDGAQACGGGGCWQRFASGALVESGGVARKMSEPIFDLWNTAGAAASPLGLPTTDVKGGLPDGGTYQKFAKGSVYHTSATGAHSVLGAIRTAWGAERYERGRFGYPTSEAYAVPGGTAQDFQHGVIVRTSAGATNLLVGTPYDVWVADGGKNSKLGYPKTSQRTGLKDSGWWQSFTGGRIMFSASTGAHVVTGPIDAKWAQQGFENGELGYPTTDTKCTLPDSGCYQHFQGGLIYDSASTPAAIVTGTVRAKWGAQGWEQGALGYPTQDTKCTLPDSGCYQHFQGGSIYDSASTPAAIVSGAVRTKWAAQGWERGKLGFPTRDTTCNLPDSGCYQHFQGGSIYVSASTPAAMVTGTVRTKWGAQGWERGTLGFPTRDTTCNLPDSGCYQHFQGGSIYDSASTPAAIVSGSIRTQWAAAGWERGKYGYPKGDAASSSGVLRQQFQGGTITAK
jgi:uncharacterized protein with LGFP repeats